MVNERHHQGEEEAQQPRERQASDQRARVAVGDVARRFDRARPQMGRCQEPCPRAGEQDAVAVSWPSRGGQAESEKDQRVDAQAVREGGDLVRQRPSRVVAAHDVVEVVA